MFAVTRASLLFVVRLRVHVSACEHGCESLSVLHTSVLTASVSEVLSQEPFLNRCCENVSGTFDVLDERNPVQGRSRGNTADL